MNRMIYIVMTIFVINIATYASERGRGIAKPLSSYKSFEEIAYNKSLDLKQIKLFSQEAPDMLLTYIPEDIAKCFMTRNMHNFMGIMRKKRIEQEKIEKEKQEKELMEKERIVIEKMRLFLRSNDNSSVYMGEVLSLNNAGDESVSSSNMPR